ncbi:hypothetical protein [Paraferrimonas sp. SM1919]|uniref:hypothetical protein n=1 Tax=Paraferrimonas sp. SM1919 TaxID=2662263 RepID=UPI0013D7645B|nr:hypothetical protein [Paraferrimonas sp. SM1919]
MSAWLDAKSNSFDGYWNELKTIVSNLEEDSMNVSEVSYVLRCKKVVAYLDAIIDSCDPELMNKDVWGNAEKQCNPCINNLNAYISQGDERYLVTANNHLDILLNYFKPSVMYKGTQATAAAASFRHYREAVDKLIPKVTKYSEAVSNLESELEVFKSNAEAKYNALEVYYDKAFEGTDEEPALEEQIDDLKLKSESLVEELEDYSAKLLIKYNSSDSIESDVEQYVDSIKEVSSTIDKTLKSIDEKVGELEVLYNTIMGSVEEDSEVVDEEGILGLKAELISAKNELELKKNEHEQYFAEVESKINDVLPRGTAAGLSQAYERLQNKTSRQVVFYNFVVFIGITLLSISGFLTVTEVPVHAIDNVSSQLESNSKKDILVELTGRSLISFESPSALLGTIFQRLPLSVPAFLLLLFSLKRRAENFRLNQEYAHKRAVAQSYVGFMKEISEMTDLNSELRNKLMSVTIDAISKNAAETLSKKDSNNETVKPTKEAVAMVNDVVKALKVSSK